MAECVRRTAVGIFARCLRLGQRGMSPVKDGCPWRNKKRKSKIILENRLFTSNKSEFVQWTHTCGPKIQSNSWTSRYILRFLYDSGYVEIASALAYGNFSVFWMLHNSQRARLLQTQFQKICQRDADHFFSVHVVNSIETVFKFENKNKRNQFLFQSRLTSFFITQPSWYLNSFVRT